MHVNASLDDIASYLDTLLDVAKYREESAANGLLYRAGEGVSKFAVAVNTSLSAIVGAAKTGAQLLVVHHPSWPENDLHLYDEKMAALAAGGISLYSAHAALDCAPNIGNGWVLAEQLGVAVDATFGDMFGGHCGVIGSASGDFGGFLRATSQALGVQVEAHEHAKSFGRVAIVAGAGGQPAMMDEARCLGADTYLTGEGKLFTRLFAQETGMNLIFGTHQATEAPGIRALGERIAAQSQLPWEYIAEPSGVF